MHLGRWNSRTRSHSPSWFPSSSFLIFCNCDVSLRSHNCFPITPVFHQHLNSHTIYYQRWSLEDVLGLEDTFWSSWPWPQNLMSSKIALSSARGQHYFLNGKNFVDWLKIVFLGRFFLEINQKKVFILFFLGKHLHLCPWLRAFLSFASFFFCVLGLGLVSNVLDSNSAYYGSPPEPSNHTREQFLHLLSYPLLRLFWSKSDKKVTKTMIPDQHRT